MIKRISPNDSLRFKEICTSLAVPLCAENASIGTYNEKRIHRTIKRFITDDESRFEVISYLKNELAGKTVVMITHNLSDATAFCDEIYKLDKGFLNKIS